MKRGMLLLIMFTVLGLLFLVACQPELDEEEAFPIVEIPPPPIPQPEPEPPVLPGGGCPPGFVFQDGSCICPPPNIIVGEFCTSEGEAPIAGAPGAPGAPQPPPAAPPRPTRKTVDVEISDFDYIPSVTRINVGDSVRWTNRGAVVHTVTSTFGPESFDRTLEPGRNFRRRFETPGRYSYNCQFHPTQMLGTIIVE